MNMDNIKISSRLKICADFVSQNSSVADIGTDHAYLPIYLIKTGKIRNVIACDINQSPLLNAEKNIQRYKLSQFIELRLSDGLKNISPQEVDTVIICGLGGETIIEILEKTTWIKKEKIKLVLQPMTRLSDLRKYLLGNSLFVDKEKLLEENGHIYNVISASFNEENKNNGDLFLYLGALERENTNKRLFGLYLSRQIKALNNEKLGAQAVKDNKKAKELGSTISKLKKLLEE